MKKTIIIVVAILVVGAGVWALLKPRSGETYGTLAVLDQKVEEEAAAAEPVYSVKHMWSEEPKVGVSTLKFIVFEKAGGKAQDVEVVACTYMSANPGQPASCEKMQQATRGVFRLPIRFASPGNWEVHLSIQKENGLEVESRTIEVSIE